MQVADHISFRRVYWVNGPIPKDARDPRFDQAVDDPPTSGWGSVLVYEPTRSDAIYAKVFDPATGWGREIPINSMELAKSEPAKEFDHKKVVTRIKKTFEANDRLGVGMSFGLANFFLEKLGEDRCTRIREDVEEEKQAKPEKQPKVDARAGLVTAADIAAELNVEPRILRDACRKLKIEKPSVGWAGDRAWADDIKARVSTFLATPKADAKAPPPAKEEAPKKKRQPKPMFITDSRPIPQDIKKARAETKKA